jgi:hypothetical protein
MSCLIIIRGNFILAAVHVVMRIYGLQPLARFHSPCSGVVHESLTVPAKRGNMRHTRRRILVLVTGIQGDASYILEAEASACPGEYTSLQQGIAVISNQTILEFQTYIAV